MVICPICQLETALQVQDHVRGGKPIGVYQCKSCDFEFLETWQDTQRAMDFYASGQYVFKPNVTEESLKFDEYAERLTRIRPYLTTSIRLLEIGCGSGKFLTLCRELVKEAHAIEITEAHVQTLRDQGFPVFDNPLEALQPDSPYDVVCMFALLEHLPKVNEFLIHLKRFLHSRSLVFIEVPDLLDPLCTYFDVSEYREFYYREYHLYYFTERSLQRLLEKAGFHCEFQHLMQASLTNHFHWLFVQPDSPYDVVCMFALLEHLPKVNEFLIHLKRFLHSRSLVFIEVPDLLDPLCTSIKQMVPFV